MDVTNKVLLEFYAKTGKREDYPITQKFLESHELSGAYIDLANTFKNEGKSGKPEYQCFYHWFEEHYVDKEPPLRSLSALKDKEPDFDFLLKDTKIKELLQNPLLQKWHLYVSFYALEEYWAKKEKDKESRRLTKCHYEHDKAQDDSGILRGGTQCQALLLWMCEAANPNRYNKDLTEDEQIKDERTEELYEQLPKHGRAPSEWLKAIKDEIISRLQNGDDQKHK